MSNNALKAVAGSNGDSASTAVGREASPYERFRDYLSKPAFMTDLRLLLGSDAIAQTFVRVVLTAVQQTPDLLSADRRTLLLACMKAARARLMPDGKEGVLNIYSTKQKDRETGAEKWIKSVQFLPMAFGLVKTLYDAKIATYVDAAAVYERDFFAYRRGDKQSLEHEPTMADDPGPIIAAYCVVVLANGETKREVMPRRDIEKVRAISKAPDGLMWKTFYDQGAIKSVIHRICKQLPSRPELDAVLSEDNETSGFRQTGSSGIDVDSDSFSGAPTSEERPAIEHNPGETIPGVVGAADTHGELIDAAKPTGAARVSRAEKLKGDGGFTMTYPEVRAAIENAGKAKNLDKLAEAEDMIRGAPAQFHEELRQLAKDTREALAA